MREIPPAPEGPARLALGVLEKAEELLAEGVRDARTEGEALRPRQPQRVVQIDAAARAAERELADRCIGGDRQAMALLYEKYKRRVYGICLRIAGHNDAEEMSQECFIRIFRGLRSFRGDSQLGTWVYRLAVNAALSHCSRRPKEVLGDELPGAAREIAPMRDVPVAVSLERAMTQLSPGYRAVLVLHDIEGLSHEEIADILGCQIGTSKSQLHKARSRMRALLGGKNDGDGDGVIS